MTSRGSVAPSLFVECFGTVLFSSGVQIFSRSQDLPDGFRRLLKKSKNSRISTGDKKLTFFSQWVFCKYEIIFYKIHFFVKINVLRLGFIITLLPVVSFYL